jgi:hypothetical protein
MNARIPALLLAALAACGYKPVKEANPAKQPAYAFPHSTHVDADVPCSACHDMAGATKLDPAVRHVKVPANASKQKPCSDCHDTNPKAIPARTREYRLTFSHAQHLKYVKDCKSCHQKLTEPGDASAPAPPMASCTACHNHQKAFAEARCTPCHTDLKNLRPETAFRHEGNWLGMHGQLTKPTAESCAQCHDQTYCVSCHSPATVATRVEVIFPERVDRAFIHRGDYVGRHTVEAQANPASCRRCHGSAFCDACHSANGFSGSNVATGTAVRPLSHTPGIWSGPPGSTNQHANEARRDISSCAGCHDQKGPNQTCVQCHAVRATGTSINPHPKRFLDTHNAADRSRNDMCRVCHPN